MHRLRALSDINSELIKEGYYITYMVRLSMGLAANGLDPPRSNPYWNNLLFCSPRETQDNQREKRENAGRQDVRTQQGVMLSFSGPSLHGQATPRAFLSAASARTSLRTERRVLQTLHFNNLTHCSSCASSLWDSCAASMAASRTSHSLAMSLSD